MSESRELLTLRGMAWQRAKGELRACLETYWTDYGTTGKEIPNGFEEADKRIEAFIKEFEDNCR